MLITDQSKLNDRYQVLMLAVRHGERALPLLPEGAVVCLMADRFYGTADQIGGARTSPGTIASG